MNTFGICGHHSTAQWVIDGWQELGEGPVSMQNLSIALRNEYNAVIEYVF